MDQDLNKSERHTALSAERGLVAMNSRRRRPNSYFERLSALPMTTRHHRAIRSIVTLLRTRSSTNPEPTELQTRRATSSSCHSHTGCPFTFQTLIKCKHSALKTSLSSAPLLPLFQPRPKPLTSQNWDTTCGSSLCLDRWMWERSELTAPGNDGGDSLASDSILTTLRA